VLAQTLRHGPREGCKIALTPLVTDAPIIALALALAAKMAQLRLLLGIVSIAGGAFVLYLAWEGFRPVRVISLSSFNPRLADQIPAVLCRRVHCQI
jgi:threonine/homoserine/homoserine lactone efflux protein